MSKFKFLKKEKIKNLPKTTGVYVLAADKKKGRGFLYIGKATNIKERVKNHFQQPSFKDYFFLEKVKKIGYIEALSEIEALILEARLIKKHKPKFNILWKDDKNYFFVGITKEEFPRVFITHQIKVKSQKSPHQNKFGTGQAKVKSSFIGPFVDGKALGQTLKILRKIFPYRSCRVLPKRACLWYQLDRCPAPCLLESSLGKQIPQAKEKMKKEYQENAKNLGKILEGKKEEVLKALRKRMEGEAKKENFKEAARIKDQIGALEKILSQAKILHFLRVSPQKDWLQIKKELRKILGKEVERIEAYDVSNIQGKQATGSAVVFIKGKAARDSFRRFKIKTKASPNDVAMIKEILERRLNHPEWPYPQLILIDGGKAQLNAAQEVVSQHKVAKLKLISVSALAKRKNELFLEGRKKPIKLDDLSQPLKFLVLWARDEAHRFARRYHHKLREIDLKPHP